MFGTASHSVHVLLYILIVCTEVFSYESTKVIRKYNVHYTYCTFEGTKVLSYESAKVRKYESTKVRKYNYSTSDGLELSLFV